MAKSVIIVDDIDGTADAKSYSFSLGEDKYTIDLGPDNYRALHEALAPFVRAATKESGKAARSDSGGRPDPAELRKVRAWAAGQGITVAPKGRIKQSVFEAYKAAGN